MITHEELDVHDNSTFNRWTISSGIKNINLDFTNIHRCVLALYTQYFPELCEKITGILLGWDANP